MRRAATFAAVLAAALVGTATPARADATVFLGATTTPTNRAVKGVAVGVTLIVLGFEFEYADTSDDPASGAPSVKTGTGNVLFQTPVSVYGFQPYFTAGGGVYHESLGTHDDTSFTADIGGGVKMSLIGPVRLRVDYRLFKPGGGALYSPAHRVYVGLNLKF
jgi:hypothetical protein